jgi:hypothetical protein
MDSTKYIGMDVHKDTISIAVMSSAGKVVIESGASSGEQNVVAFSHYEHSQTVLGGHGRWPLCFGSSGF